MTSAPAWSGHRRAPRGAGGAGPLVARLVAAGGPLEGRATILFDETGEGGGTATPGTSGGPTARRRCGWARAGAGASRPTGDGRSRARSRRAKGLVLLPVLRRGGGASSRSTACNCHGARWIPDGKAILAAANEAGAGAAPVRLPARRGAAPADHRRGDRPRLVPDLAGRPARGRAERGPVLVPRAPAGGRGTAAGAGTRARRSADDLEARTARPCSASGAGGLPGGASDSTSSRGAREVHRELKPRDAAGVVEIVSGIQLTPDGRSYAYSQHRILSDLFLVDGLR